MGGLGRFFFQSCCRLRPLPVPQKCSQPRRRIRTEAEERYISLEVPETDRPRTPVRGLNRRTYGECLRGIPVSFFSILMSLYVDHSSPFLSSEADERAHFKSRFLQSFISQFPSETPLAFTATFALLCLTMFLVGLRYHTATFGKLTLASSEDSPVSSPIRHLRPKSCSHDYIQKPGSEVLAYRVIDLLLYFLRVSTVKSSFTRLKWAR